MIYKETVQIPSTEKIVTHTVASCVKCDSDNIDLSEYEDQYGFISTAKCKNCKSEVKRNTVLNGVITEWNKHNDIALLIPNKLSRIAALKEEIKELKIKQKQRSKIKKPLSTK